MGRFAVILPAAGKSTRFGKPGQKKVYEDLGGEAVWARAVRAFHGREDVGQIVLAIAGEDRAFFQSRFGALAGELGVEVIDGGAERHDTVARALEVVHPGCDMVAVHDAARPCLTRELIDAIFSAALEHGAALPGLPLWDTVKRVGPEGLTVETVPRSDLVAVQTPQVFRRKLLEQAYAQRRELPVTITDDAQLVEALGHSCKVVEGSPWNIKITSPRDLRLAEAMLGLLASE